MYDGIHKVIANDVKIEVTSYEDEDFDFTNHNVEQGVADNIGNMQSAEDDEHLDYDEDSATKRKEPSTCIKNNHPIDNFIGYLDE